MAEKIDASGLEPEIDKLSQRLASCRLQKENEEADFQQKITRLHKNLLSILEEHGVDDSAKALSTRATPLISFGKYSLRVRQSPVECSRHNLTMGDPVIDMKSPATPFRLNYTEIFQIGPSKAWYLSTQEIQAGTLGKEHLAVAEMMAFFIKSALNFSKALNSSPANT